MYRRAGDMVSNGWQNPFSMPAQPQQPSLEQQLSQYAPQTQYQPPPPRAPSFGDLAPMFPDAPMTTMYYDPSTGMATHQPPAAPQYQPAPSQPAQGDPGMNDALGGFDPLYGQGTAGAWQAAGAPKSAPLRGSPHLAGLMSADSYGRTPSPEEEAIYRNNPFLLK